MPRTTARTRSYCGFCPMAAAALLLLCAPAAQGQMATETVGEGEFPGLQLLPVGSVLKGISLPRYEGHRVSALFTADRMEVKSRSLVLLSNLKVHLYDKNGETTDLESGGAAYDFAHTLVTSPTPVRLVSPRMEAQGPGLVYDTNRHVGIIKGPVDTAVRTETAAATPKAKKP